MPPFATCQLRAEVPRRPRALTHRERPARRPGPRRVGGGPCAVLARRTRAPPGHDDRLASTPRCHLRLGRRLPRRGLHAPRPRIEHDDAAGAGDRLLDRGDMLVPRRPTGQPPPRRWPPGRGEPAHAARRPSRSKGRPRRRRAPTAAAQGPRRAARSALGSMQPARGRSRPDHGRGLRRGRCRRPRRGSGSPARCPQGSAASAGSCLPGGWQPSQERSRARPETPRARLDSRARPVPTTWSPSPLIRAPSAWQRAEDPDPTLPCPRRSTACRAPAPGCAARRADRRRQRPDSRARGRRRLHRRPRSSGRSSLGDPAGRRSRPARPPPPRTWPAVRSPAR